MKTKAVALVLAAGTLFTLPATAETLNVYNWSDYIGETTLADFTKETGIDVNYDVYDNNEVVEAKLLAGSSGYDIVVPTAQPYLSRLIEAGAVQKLDKSKIPNLKNLDPKLMERVASADPGNEYAVIYQWGTNGIGYNVTKIKERMPDAPMNSWAMVFDKNVVSKFADCGVTLLDSANEVIPLALNYLGKDPLSQDAEELKAAEALLIEIRPYVRYFHSSQYINDLSNGEVCLSVGYSGDIGIAATRAEEAGNGIEIQYAIPKEGTMVWFDTLAIPADAPNPEAAHKFINFVLQPEVIAGVTNYVTYPNAVPASLPMVDEAIKSNPNIYPPQEVMDRLFAQESVSPSYDRLRSRAWTRVRTGK